MLQLPNFRMTLFFMVLALYGFLTSEPDLAALLSDEDRTCSTRRHIVSVLKYMHRDFK